MSVCACACVYVHACMCVCAYADVNSHVWRPEFGIRCLPQSLFIDVFETGSLIDPGSCWLGYMGWPAKPQWLSCFHFPSKDKKHLSTPPGFLCGFRRLELRSSRLHTKLVDWAVFPATDHPVLTFSLDFCQTACIYVRLCHLPLFQPGLPRAVCLRIETQFATMEMKKGKARDVESEHEFPAGV